MENFRAKIAADMWRLQVIMQLVLFALWQDSMVNLSFLVGGLISLGNFHWMARNCEQTVAGEHNSSVTKAYGSFIIRFAVMAVLVMLSFSRINLVPLAFFPALLSLQVVLLAREVLGRFIGQPN